MNRLVRRTACLLASLFLMAALLKGAGAQTYDPHTGDPPPGQHVLFTDNQWNVVPTPDGKGIKGTIRLDCYTDEYDTVFVNVKGMVPGGKYTCWMVNQEGGGPDAERAGVSRHWDGDDATKYDFRAEKDGRGYYHGWLSRCPLGRWKYIEVRYHPDGNEKNLEGSVPVLHARCKPQ